jgi:hypothetical protein
MTAKVPDPQRSVPTGGGATPVRDGPAHMEAAAADALPCIDDSHVNEVEFQPEDALGGDALVPESLRGPRSHPPEDTIAGDVISAPDSSDIVDNGAMSSSYWATPDHHPCLVAGGRWRETQS